MNAALAAWHGVPVIAVSGDDVAVAEVKAAAPGVRTVAVKRAINVRAVELRPLAEARQELQQAVRDGVAAAKPTPPHPAKSYRVQMQFRSFTHAQVVTAFREIQLVSADTVAFTRPTMPEAYRLIRVLYRFINPD